MFLLFSWSKNNLLKYTVPLYLRNMTQTKGEGKQNTEYFCNNIIQRKEVKYERSVIWFNAGKMTEWNKGVLTRSPHVFHFRSYVMNL